MAVRDAIIHFGEVLAKHFGIPAINKTGGALTKGTLVYISGWDSTTKRFKIDVASATTPIFATAVLTSAVAIDGATVARPSANVTGLNTSGKTIGDPVYLSAAGALTYTIPSTNIQVLGYVTKVDATDGAIEFDLAYAGAFSAKAALVPTDLAVTGKASTNLAQDDLCYVSSVTAAGVPIMTPADADGAGKAATWICTGTILSGATGLFRKAVLSAGVETNAATVGDPVYLTITGTTTNTWSLTPPSGADDIVQIAGRVTIKAASPGGQIMWDLASGSGVKSVGTNELAAESVTLAKIVRDAASGKVPITQGAASDIQYNAISGDATLAGNGALTIGAAKVTVAKAGGFFSTEVTGTGAPQNVAHGLTGTPKFLCVPSVSAAGVSIAAQSADATNITLTMAGTDKCFIFAWV